MNTPKEPRRLSLPELDDPELHELGVRFQERVIELTDNGLAHDEQVVLLTQIMRAFDAVNEWAAHQREQAVYDLFYNSERDVSMASVARRAGVTPQALTRVLAIARAKRAGTEDEEF